MIVKELSNYIDYIHISDNGGIRVEHLPVGGGIINWEEFFNTLDKLNFKGYLGLDIGGDESNVDDLHNAYTDSAKWIENNWLHIKN